MSFWKNPDPVTHIDGLGDECCNTHHLKLNDNGTCPADSPEVDPVQVGDVWRDTCVHDTVTVEEVAHDAKGRMTDVAGRFGDGSGPYWYTRDEFLNDCVPIAMEPVTDAPDRKQFADGGMRDVETGKPRFDLLCPERVPYDKQYLTRVAKLMGRGAEHYEDRNWEKFADQEAYDRAKSSAFRHFMQWFNGETDEDHAAAVFFNVQATEYVKGRMDGEW